MKCKLIFFVIILSFYSVFSQDTLSNLNVKGFVDTYYSYDFSEPISNLKPDFLYNHNRHNEINVNMALIQVDYSSEKLRSSVGLMVGTYPQYNLAHEQDLLKNIFEANVGIELVNDLWLDAGVFGSHLGFESAISTENITLTRSLMAENSPYYLSGAKLTYQGVEKWTFTALISNGWQNIRETFGNTNKAVGTQLVFEPNDKILINYSNWWSNESTSKTPIIDYRGYRFFNNFYTIISPKERLNVIAALDYGLEQNRLTNAWNTWYVPAVLVGYKWHKNWHTGMRAEYYVDQNGVIIQSHTPNGFKTFGASINLDYKPVKNAFLRIEARWLNSKDAIFNAPNFTNSNANLAITASLAVTFGN